MTNDLIERLNSAALGEDTSWVADAMSEAVWGGPRPMRRALLIVLTATCLSGCYRAQAEAEFRRHGWPTEHMHPYAGLCLKNRFAWASETPDGHKAKVCTGGPMDALYGPRFTILR